MSQLNWRETLRFYLTDYAGFYRAVEELATHPMPETMQ
jgi:hypothetical protein